MYHLLAEAASPIPGFPSDISSWGQLTAQGVMLGLFAWLITVGIPKMVAEFRAESALSRKWHEEQVEGMNERAEKREQVFERCVDRFINGKSGQ